MVGMLNCQKITRRSRPCFLDLVCSLAPPLSIPAPDLHLVPFAIVAPSPGDIVYIHLTTHTTLLC